MKMLVAIAALIVSAALTVPTVTAADVGTAARADTVRVSA